RTLLHPLRIAPFIAAEVGDDGSVVRSQLHLKAVGIRLEHCMPRRRPDLELVERADAETRNEQIPHPGVADALHAIAGTVPTVEIADYADTARIGCPHREARTVDTIDRLEVCAELVVDVVVVAFAEEVKVEIGERGHWAVGCRL